MATRWLVLVVMLATVVVALAGKAGTASAHAQLVRSDPSPGASLAQSPPRVTVWLSEPVIPEGSRLEVYDVAGRRVDRGVTYYHGSPPSAMSIDLEPLAEGNYRVRWITLSPVDGHYVVGTFPFAVGVEATVPAGGAEGGVTSGLTVPRWLPVLLRYITLAGALGWGGMAFMHALVAGPWLSAGPGSLPLLAVGLSHRFRRAILLAILALLVGRALEAAWPMVATMVITQVSTGWQSALALLTSRFSLVSWSIVALAALAALASWRHGPVPLVAGGAETMATRPLPTQSVQGEVWAARSHGVLAALAMLGLASTGHAGVVSGPYLSSLLAAWLHYLAAAVWVGGLFYFVAVVLPATSVGDASERGRARVALFGRFTPYALLSGLVLAATGLLRAEVHLPPFSLPMLKDVVNTTYGQALAAKLALVALMASIGAAHAFRQRRQVAELLARGAGQQELGRPLRLWQRLVRLEAVVALLLLVAVALLLTTPALRYGVDRPATLPAGGSAQQMALAQALLERAERSMNSLKSARVRERPGGSNSAGWTDYVLVAPASMRIQTSAGDETVVWWNLMFTRRSGETSWQVGFWSPVYRFTWPNYVWSRTANRPSVVGREEVSGTPCIIVSFTDAAESTRYTLWIGERDGLVRREEVVSVGYHTVREYFDFDAPLEVSIPEDVPHD
jgi:copper transport protein